MQTQELGLMVPPEDEPEPWKKGIATLLAFICFGLIPLIGECERISCVKEFYACVYVCVCAYNYELKMKSLSSHTVTAYVALNSIHWNGWDPVFFISCVMTGVSLFTLGAVKV